MANRDAFGDIKAVITAHENTKTDWKTNTDKLPNELNNTLPISPVKIPNGPRNTVNHVLTTVSSIGYVCCVAISYKTTIRALLPKPQKKLLTNKVGRLANRNPRAKASVDAKVSTDAIFDKI